MSMQSHADNGEDFKLTKADKRVLLFIAQHENQYLSFRFLAKGLDLSSQTVKLSKKKLLVGNLLICSKGERLAPDLNSPNRYALTEKGAWVVRNLTNPPRQNLATSSDSRIMHQADIALWGFAPQTPKPTSDFQPRQLEPQESSKPAEKLLEAPSGRAMFAFLDDSDAHQSPSSPVRSLSGNTGASNPPQ
jgi:hypothetical protein